MSKTQMWSRISTQTDIIFPLSQKKQAEMIKVLDSKRNPREKMKIFLS